MTLFILAELNDLHLPDTIKITKIEFEPAIAVEVELLPDEGPFAGAAVHFTISIPEMYPHRPPKARIHEKVNFSKAIASTHCNVCVRSCFIQILTWKAMYV